MTNNNQPINICLNEELLCPISQEILDDPIVVPCCTRAFSREYLVKWLNTSYEKSCPNCRNSLIGFNALSAPKNIILANIVEIYQKINDSHVNIFDKVVENHVWDCTLTPVIGQNGTFINVAELKLSITRSNFITRPSVFIAVIDKSGSMAGNSWNQVQSALIHMLSLASTNNKIKLIIITYDSFANVVDTSGSLELQCAKIKSIYAGGGTTFRSAFTKIQSVLSNFIYSNDVELLNEPTNIGNVTICFLTDGQSGDTNPTTLADDFRIMLQDSWQGPICVHSVGFSSGCDKELLEKMRTCGNIEGIFRYAEPTDNCDTLCQKLQSLFDVVNKSGLINLQLELSPNMKFRKNDSINLDVQLIIDEFNNGVYKTWVYFETSAENNYIKIGSGHQTGVPEDLANVVIDARLNLEKNATKKQTLTQTWYDNLVDELAAEFVDVVKKFDQNKNINTMRLHCGLILQRINALCQKITSTISQGRLEYIENQVNQLLEGHSVNIGKLYDIRFASALQSTKLQSIKSTNYLTPDNKSNLLDNKNAFKEYAPRHYSLNNNGKDRNVLQQAIANSIYNKLTNEFLTALKNSTIDDICHLDADGNTALILAAYCGFSQIIENIFEKYQNIDPNIENIHGETAITLAIKARGFWKTITLLLKNKHTIPPHRLDGLKQYAIEKGFVKTGQLLSNYGTNSYIVNTTMTDDYIKYLFHEAVDNNITIDINNYLHVCLAKGIFDIVITLLTKYNAVLTIDMLMNYCIPNIPDSPKTDQLLKLCDTVLGLCPQLLRQCNEDGESLLFKSAERGSLPHVKYFISKQLPIDQQNNLGNSPLWIACAKRYPCIITELLENGADVNLSNLKGNPPMYNICQKGPKKVIDILLSYGADISIKNTNGDTLILICCRNGQHEILDTLLNYADDDLIHHKAHIDGFSAIMSAAEQNRADCIKVLHAHGIDVNQRTDADNNIIANATPLHIAAYYNRLEALVALLDCNADPTLSDHNNLTPLHLSVMQGNINIAKTLKARVPKLMNIRDAMGYLPMAYCRNDREMCKILTDPVLIPLIDLCKNRFSANEQIDALDILTKYVGSYGIINSSDCVNIQDSNGFTPLMHAVIYSNYNVVQKLLELGCNPLITNFTGVNCLTYAKWINNAKIKKILMIDNYSDMLKKPIENLEKACASSPESRQIMFLGIVPKNIQDLQPNTICHRMENSQYTFKIIDNSDVNINLPNVDDEPMASDSEHVPTISNLQIVNIFKNRQEIPTEQVETIIWNSKVFVVGLISTTNYLTPAEIYCVNIFTNNNIFQKIINEWLVNTINTNNNIEQYLKCFTTALNKIDTYEGEVFLGSNLIDRNNFRIGNVVTNVGFVSTSTMWRVAVEHLDDYQSKKKQGNVFIIKSKTGKLVSIYSQFAIDSEVIFKPGAKFIVTNWYRGGDFIVLGQQNIREHTYKLTDDEIYQISNTNKSLVIEMSEV